MFNTLINACLLISALIAGVWITLSIWNKPVFVIHFQLIYCCFMRFLTQQLHIPEVIKYLSDYLTIILFIQIVLHFNKTRNINIFKPLLFIFLYLATVLISTFSNGSSFIFFIWGARVNIRFFVFFLACVIFLRKNNLDNLMKFLLFLLPLNTVLVLFQYFVMGNRDDYIGGFFGVWQGCNGELLLYLLVVTAISIFFYISNKMNIFRLIVNIGLVSLIAAISELKFIFIILVIMMFFAVILTFPSVRALKMSFAGVAIVISAFLLFLILYPDWRNEWGSLQSAIFASTEKNYAGSQSLSRFTAGSYILQNIILEPRQRLFGIGFGNADKFLSFTSSFYNRYEELGYGLFSYTLMFIEIGILGLIIYCLFFASISIDSLRVKYKSNPNMKFYLNISFIVSITVFLLILYNQSMYLDAAFIIFFILSFPFIIEKELFIGSSIVGE